AVLGVGDLVRGAEGVDDERAVVAEDGGPAGPDTDVVDRPGAGRACGWCGVGGCGRGGERAGRERDRADGGPGAAGMGGGTSHCSSSSSGEPVSSLARGGEKAVARRTLERLAVRESVCMGTTETGFRWACGVGVRVA